jgi:hypothetical protein
MSTFNITPQDLQNMITRLTHWSQQLDQIRGSMNTYSQSLRQTWRDPQFDSYINNIELIGKSLGLNAADMAQTAKTLNALKQNLERTRAEYERMIANRQR